MKKYKQLDQEQRYTIEKMLKEGYTQSSISKVIGVHRSTVSREISRNTAKRGRFAKNYSSKRAQEKAFRREREKPKAYKFCSWMLSYIRDQLRIERWSPELISVKGREIFGNFVSN